MLHALNHTLQWLLVSTVFGTVSSLHLISFLHLFHSFYPNREHRGLPSLALRMVFLPSTDGYLPGYRSHVSYIIRSCARSISENTHARRLVNGVAYCRNFRISQSRLLKGTYCLYVSKDHVRPVSKRLCIIFMACSCPNFVLGCLKKKKRKKKKKKMEKIAVFPFAVYNSSDVF